MRTCIAALLAIVLTACGGTAAVPDDTTGASTLGDAGSSAAPSLPAASAPAASEPAASAPAASATAASEEASAAGLPDASAAAGAAPEQVIAQVTQTLEQQFGVSADDFTLESAEPMEWSDGSLGCPDPSKFYTQSIVSGYLLNVSDGTRSYEIHTNEDGSQAVVCENGRPLEP